MPRVLLLHGFDETPESWITKSTQNKILPYNLANSGYDVWIGTWRGGSTTSEYSDHTQLNSVLNGKQYYNFTLETRAEIDFPAMMDFIFKSTPVYELSIIAHNIGASSAIIQMSETFYAD
jgi:predicted alpha/beta hydrolase